MLPAIVSVRSLLYGLFGPLTWLTDPFAILLLPPQVEDFMLDMLLAYRKKCASDSPAGQLIIPDGLRVLPLFTLCTHKILALRPNSGVGGVSH